LEKTVAAVEESFNPSLIFVTSPNFNIAKWPDGRILNHPEHFVRT
jgi:hypothetical protein